jgi:hypothetical protein
VTCFTPGNHCELKKHWRQTVTDCVDLIALRD